VWDYKLNKKILVWDFNLAENILVWDYNLIEKILVWDYKLAEKILLRKCFDFFLILYRQFYGRAAKFCVSAMNY